MKRRHRKTLNRIREICDLPDNIRKTRSCLTERGSVSVASNMADCSPCCRAPQYWLTDHNPSYLWEEDHTPRRLRSVKWSSTQEELHYITVISDKRCGFVHVPKRDWARPGRLKKKEEEERTGSVSICQDVLVTDRCLWANVSCRMHSVFAVVILRGCSRRDSRVHHRLITNKGHSNNTLVWSSVQALLIITLNISTQSDHHSYNVRTKPSIKKWILSSHYGTQLELHSERLNLRQGPVLSR